MFFFSCQYGGKCIDLKVSGMGHAISGGRTHQVCVFVLGGVTERERAKERDQMLFIHETTHAP